MALVSGPRQVGKTTTCRTVAEHYLNWDNLDDRRRLLAGPASVAAALELDRLRAEPPVAVLDELHKYAKWKGLLKGLFDSYGDRVRLIVTGSSRLDVFRRGGDSLMGRYYLWSDLGLGRFELCYLRDKLKREVDFVVIRDDQPWCLVEVKKGDRSLTPALAHFQSETKAPHAMQVVIDLPFEKADCFTHQRPIVVPAKTFLSQLV